MISAPMHADEPRRIAALRDLNILDTAPEDQFDRITRLARRMFDAPIALVSLVDTDRQWFKSRQGLDAEGTPRDVSFCAHAILRDSVMVVPDACEDPRFEQNPLVTGNPNIRFYAGAPLRSPNGLPVGTLCIIDTKPREWTEAESSTLIDLALMVEEVLVHRLERGEHLALRAITAVTALGTTDHDELLRQALRIGAEQLQMPTGIVSRIEGDTYEIVAHVSPDESLQDGLVIEVSRTCCDMTLAAGDVLGIAHFSTSSRAQHPCIDDFGVESYIGVPLTIEGRLFGTLNFNSPDGHPTPSFSPSEVDFVRVLGRWLEGAIARKLQADQLLNQSQLLSVITHAQSDFITSANRKTAFEKLLSNVLSLTSCEYGFIGEVLHDDEGAPYLKTRALTNIAWNEATRLLYAAQDATGLDFRNLNTLFGRTLTTGDPVIANEPYRDARRGGLPADHPPMSSYLGLPLHLGDRFVGMLGLANHPGGFDESWVNNLEPLTTTIAQLIEAARGQESRRRDQADIARLSQVASQMTNGLVITDLDGRIDWVNAAFTRMFGYFIDDVIGLRPRDVLFSKRVTDHSLDLVDEAMSGLEPFAVEQLVRDRRQREFWVGVAGTPLLDEVGETAGFIVVVTDISERKRVEAMKSEFISTISHELRTPLTSIAGSLGLVAGGATGQLPERAQQMIQIAQKNSQRLSTLINDLLDLEKLVEGGLPIIPEPHNLSVLVDRAIQDNQGYAERFGIEFTPGEVDEGLWINVDSLRFIQVMSNLLSNAAKFSPQGAKVHIGVDHDVTQGTVTVSVRDVGAGIPEQFQERVFDKFAQADSSDSRSRGGSGLGLTISRELVERMNGSIEFTSVVGMGTTFFVTLPTTDEHPSAKEIW